MTFLRPVSAAIVASLCAGCSTVPRIVTEYRIDVQQGNVLTQEMVSQLRPGLTKDQVRFILGTPVLMDIFHGSRWDYVYWLKKGSTGTVEQRRLSTLFDGEGKLVRVTGDVTAAQAGDRVFLVESRNREMDLGTLNVDAVTSAPQTEGKGFFGRIMETLGL